jgi:hypothetical protein
MKQIKKVNELIGLIIEQVEYDINGIWVKFTDNSFVVIESEHICNDFHASLICQNDKSDDNIKLLNLNLITIDSYNNAILIMETKRQEEEKQKKEEEEKALLKYLSIKYFKDERTKEISV